MLRDKEAPILSIGDKIKLKSGIIVQVIQDEVSGPFFDYQVLFPDGLKKEYIDWTEIDLSYQYTRPDTLLTRIIDKWVKESTLSTGLTPSEYDNLQNAFASYAFGCVTDPGTNNENNKFIKDKLMKGITQ